MSHILTRTVRLYLPKIKIKHYSTKNIFSHFCKRKKHVECWVDCVLNTRQTIWSKNVGIKLRIRITLKIYDFNISFRVMMKKTFSVLWKQPQKSLFFNNKALRIEIKHSNHTQMQKFKFSHSIFSSTFINSLKHFTLLGYILLITQ